MTPVSNASKQEPELEAAITAPSPVLVRQQELRQQINQVNQRISELRTQQNMIKDLIDEHVGQIRELMGALKESMRTTEE